MKKILSAFLLIFISLTAFTAYADDEAAPASKYSYFSLEPEITTNFITEGKKLGFINVKVDLMVGDPSLVPELEYHAPLIRDAIIETLGQESEVRIKSLSGREEIRKACLENVNALLLAETNKKILADLLFTKYLYQ